MSYLLDKLNFEDELYDEIYYLKYGSYCLTNYDEMIKENVDRDFSISNSTGTINKENVTILHNIGIKTYEDLATCNPELLKSSFTKDQLKVLVDDYLAFFDNLLYDDDIRALATINLYSKMNKDFKNSDIALSLFDKNVDHSNIKSKLQCGSYFIFGTYLFESLVEPDDEEEQELYNFVKILLKTFDSSSKKEYQYLYEVYKSFERGTVDFNILNIGKINQNDVEREVKFLSQIEQQLDDCWDDDIPKYRKKLHTNLTVLEEALHHNFIDENTFVACLTPDMKEKYEMYKYRVK